jgi:hypothetical protein
MLTHSRYELIGHDEAHGGRSGFAAMWIGSPFATLHRHEE